MSYNCVGRAKQEVNRRQTKTARAKQTKDDKKTKYHETGKHTEGDVWYDVDMTHYT